MNKTVAAILLAAVVAVSGCADTNQGPNKQVGDDDNRDKPTVMYTLQEVQIEVFCHADNEYDLRLGKGQYNLEETTTEKVGEKTYYKGVNKPYHSSITADCGNTSIEEVKADMAHYSKVKKSDGILLENKTETCFVDVEITQEDLAERSEFDRGDYIPGSGEVTIDDADYPEITEAVNREARECITSD